VVEVTEQEIMDSMLLANRNGHIACTQGGESLAGLRSALRAGLVSKNEVAVVDATAHHLKFIGFQQMYYDNSFPAEFEVTPKPEFQNRPRLLTPAASPTHSPWTPEEIQEFTRDMVGQVAAALGLKRK
jgi:threonine synthase